MHMQEIGCKRCNGTNYVKSGYTGDFEVYRKVIPNEKLTQGKKHTIGIEQNNSNVRHYLGRMTRKTKVVSKSIEMINISLSIIFCAGTFKNHFTLAITERKSFTFIFSQNRSVIDGLNAKVFVF